MKCIGIDIGSYSLKILELDFSPKGLQLLSFKEHVFTSESFEDNQVFILEAFKNLSLTNEAHQTKYVLSLSQSSISHRYKFFPFKDRHKILRSLPFELEEDIPFDQDNAIFDSKLIHYRGNTSDVIASACRKSHVKALLQLCEDGSIDPDIVTSNGLSFANAFEGLFQPAPIAPELPEEPDDENEDETGENEHAAPIRRPGALILNIGHTTTTISTFRDSRLIDTQMLNWGGQQVALKIQKTYDIHYQEALKEMQSKAFLLTSEEGASQDQVFFSQTIAASLKEMLAELKLYLFNIQTDRNVQIEQVWLTGGTSQIRNLNSFVQQQLSIKTSTLDAYYASPHSFETNFPVEKNTAAISPAALFIALEAVKRPVNPATNFRKEEFVKESQVLKLFFEKWSYTLKLASVALVAFFFYAFAKSYFAESIDETSGQKVRQLARSAGLKGPQSRPRGIRRYITKKQKEIKSREGLMELIKMDSALDIVGRISAALPDGKQVSLNLQKLEVKNDQASISGTVGNQNQLQLVRQSLQKIASGGQLRTRPNTFISSTTSNLLPFAYDFTLDRKWSENSRRASNQKNKQARKRTPRGGQ